MDEKKQEPTTIDKVIAYVGLVVSLFVGYVVWFGWPF